MRSSDPIFPEQRWTIERRCREHRLRGNSVARAVIGRPFEVLTYGQACVVLEHLKSYTSDRTETKYIEESFCRRLDLLLPPDEDDDYLGPELRVLALLATNRVATEGQCARFAFGTSSVNEHRIRDLIAPVLEKLKDGGQIGYFRDVTLDVLGIQTSADVLYLSEKGSDRLHANAPHLNYYANTNADKSRLEHDLWVTEARLDIQDKHEISLYDPERQILSDQQRARLKRSRRGGNRSRKPPAGDEQEESGCGDLRAYVRSTPEDPWRRIEVEVSRHQRGERLRLKPRRITHHYTSSRHLLDVVEAQFGILGKLVPDVRRPLRAEEMLPTPERKIAAARKTLGSERVAAVEAALKETMGGAATPHAIAKITGYSSTAVGEALAYLSDVGRIARRDGFFPLAKKLGGRTFRLYHCHEVCVESIFDFTRLMIASALVATGSMNHYSDHALEVTSLDARTGIMIFGQMNGTDRVPFCVVIDDESATPEDVVRWSGSVAKRIISGELYGGEFPLADSSHATERVLIATSAPERAVRLREASSHPVLGVTS